MNLIASRLALTQRCTIERDVAGADAWSGKGEPEWTPIATDLPCRAWTDAGREAVSAERTVAVIDRRVIVPAGTDVTEHDRIASVTERGTEVFEGPMDIEAVLVWPEHIELVLVRTR